MDGLNSFEDLTVSTLSNPRFSSQVIREREQVVYSSMTASAFPAGTVRGYLAG